MVAVAITADGAMLIGARKQQFPVGAGLVARQLVRGQAVEIHRLHVRVASAAAFGDLLFVGNSDKIRARRLGLPRVLLRGIPAVAAVAGDLMPGVDASLHLFPLVGVADDTIIVLDVLGTGRGGQTNSQKQQERKILSYASISSSRMAFVTVHLLPHIADIDRMAKRQAVRTFSIAPGGPCSIMVWQTVQSRESSSPGVGGMVSVVAAKTPRRDQMADVVGIRVPPGLHPGEK